MSSPAPGVGVSGRTLQVLAPDGVPEIRPGDDLAGALLGALASAGEQATLRDGDVLVVTSKVVSKAEGRVVRGDRDEWIEAETVREVARRGPTRIVRNHLGLTMAAAGIDASNVEAGSLVLLPRDADHSARTLRAEIRERTGVNVAVVVTDTAGRAWREGQTDIAIGAAGLVVLDSFAGRVDAHGNPLVVTAPAVADEIAGAAELAQGKLGARPCAVVRGRDDLVLPPGEDGPGAAALVRPEGGDMFGLGAREAVIAAVAGRDEDRAPFGAPAGVEDLLRALARVGIDAEATGPAQVRCPAGDEGRAGLVAFAHGWRSAGRDAQADTDLRLVPHTP